MNEWGGTKREFIFIAMTAHKENFFHSQLMRRKYETLKWKKTHPAHTYTEHCKVFGLRRTLNKRENAKEEKVEEKDMAKKVCRNKNIDITAKHFNSSGIFSKCPKSRHFSKKKSKINFECRNRFFWKIQKV